MTTRYSLCQCTLLWLFAFLFFSNPGVAHAWSPITTIVPNQDQTIELDTSQFADEEIDYNQGARKIYARIYAKMRISKHLFGTCLTALVVENQTSAAIDFMLYYRYIVDGVPREEYIFSLDEHFSPRQKRKESAQPIMQCKKVTGIQIDIRLKKKVPERISDQRSRSRHSSTPPSEEDASAPADVTPPRNQRTAQPPRDDADEAGGSQDGVGPPGQAPGLARSSVAGPTQDGRSSESGADSAGPDNTTDGSDGETVTYGTPAGRALGASGSASSRPSYRGSADSSGTSSQYVPRTSPIDAALIGYTAAAGISLVVLGAIALAYVDFGDAPLRGDITIDTFLGPASHGDRANLSTGARVIVSPLFRFQRPGYGIQFRVSSQYRYYSYFPKDGELSDTNRETHLLQIETLILFRIRQLGVGWSIGPELMIQSGLYTTESYLDNVGYVLPTGPAISFQIAEPRKDSNLQFIFQWLPLASISDLKAELKWDIGALSLGGYVSLIERQRSSRNDSGRSADKTQLIPSGGIQIGIRIPW